MKTFDWKSCFKEHPVFWDLDEQELDSILDDNLSREEICQPEQVIVREGEPGNSVYLIGQGEVEIVLMGDGGTRTPIALLGPGEIFGEMAVLEEKPRMATVLARDQCTLLEIDGNSFREFLAKHPAIEFKVAAKLSQRLRDVTEHVLTARFKDVDQKLALFNNKLESELRVIDASMKATQAVFDQTNKRANEIIESAERSRSRLTASVSVIAGVIGILVTALGFVGVEKVNQLEGALETYAEFQRTMPEIQKKVEQIDVLNKDLESKSEKMVDLNRRISDASESLSENVTRFHLAVSIPNLAASLKGYDPTSYGQYADLMKRDDREITARLFKVVIGGLSDATELSGGRERYIDLLRKSINDGFLTKEQEVISYFLMLSTMLIAGKGDFTDFLPRYHAAATEYPKTQESARVLLEEELQFDADHFPRVLDAEFEASGKSGNNAKNLSEAELQSRRETLQSLWDELP